MKKLMFLCVALLVTPAMAMITFSGDVTDGILTVRYSSDGDLPRGVALLLTGTDTAQIDGYVAASADTAFNCFIDYAFTAEDAYVIDPDNQHPLADPDNPGVVLSLPATAVSVCMGVLDQTENQGAGPLEADPLFQLEVSGEGNIVVTADTLRGPESGVVGSELESNLSGGGELSIPVDGGPPPLLTAETAIDPINAFNYYQTWLDMGEPRCWAYARQCRGDANGDDEGGFLTGYWYVGVPDLDILASGWMVKEPPKGPGIASIPNAICADFNHDDEGGFLTGYWRVGVPDLDRLAASWMVKEPTKGPGVPADCGGTAEPL